MLYRIEGQVLRFRRHLVVQYIRRKTPLCVNKFLFSVKWHFKISSFQRKGLQLFALMLISFSLAAQPGEQLPLYNWYTLGFKGRISKHWQLSLSRQYSFPAQLKAVPKYYQDDIRITYRLGKRWEILGGWTYLINKPTDSRPSMKQRAAFAVGWRKSRHGWAFGSRLQAERHFQESRYDGRLIWTNRIAYNRLRLFHHIRIQPYLSGQLYYFLGGNGIRQYDESGEMIGRRSTYGLHRARFRSGLSIRPLSWLQLNLGYLYQTEFNTAHAYRHHHQINEVNPANGKISRAYQNYHAWTTSITFTIGYKTKNNISP